MRSGVGLALIAGIAVLFAAGLVLALDVPGVLASGGRTLEDPARFGAGVGFGLAAAGRRRRGGGRRNLLDQPRAPDRLGRGLSNRVLRQAIAG